MAAIIQGIASSAQVRLLEAEDMVLEATRMREQAMLEIEYAEELARLVAQNADEPVDEGSI